MNQILKFRQRNLNNGQYHYWGEVNGIWENPKIQDNYAHPQDSQQYICLEDKNGVEIFEGDKVSFIKTHNSEKYIGVVQYCEEVAGFMLSTMNNDPWYSFEFGLGTIELEVVT